MARFRRTRVAFALCATVVLALLVPPYVNLNRYKARIAGAIAGAVGRPVTVGDVSLRLLPQPGFTLSNFVVQDDPAFGSEPLLRAEQVNAALRMSSLWRGRLEVARLSLQQPSLNLVYSRESGHWNVEALLLKAAQTPTAPTPSKRPEARPRFPYIEASGGRINLKQGAEKTVWALADADFALWLASEDEWNARLAARPVRTDANLGMDIGELRMDAKFQRASRLHNMPVSARLSFNDAQLGQLTTLIYGRDRGWRARVNGSVDVTGTPANLTLTADARLEQFRRYDINATDDLALHAHCVATWTSAGRRLDPINCESPVGNGDVTARGAVWFNGGRHYDLGLVAHDVPLEYAVKLLRHAKRDLAGDLGSEGVVNAVFSARTGDDGTISWSGGGETRDARLTSRALDTPVDLGTLQFVIGTDAEDTASKASHVRLALRKAAAAQPAEFRVAVRPFVVALGGAEPAAADGVFTRSGYELNVTGRAEIARLLRVARALGIPAPASDATGAARIQARIAGAWTGFQQPSVTGSADIHDARVNVAGVNGPVSLRNAALTLTPDSLDAEKLQIALGDGSLVLSGWIKRPRVCTAPCPVSFELHADRLALDDVHRALNTQAAAQPWYRRGNAQAKDILFSRIRATGHITVGTLLVKQVTAQNAQADVAWTPGALELQHVSASTLGGKIAGEWRADFSGASAQYSGSGSVQGMAMTQLATAMNDPWASGTLDGNYQFSTSGTKAAELTEHAAGALDFRWRDGALRHVRLSGVGTVSTGLAVRDFRGHVALRDGTFSFSQSRLESPSGIYMVSGTASRKRELALQLVPARHGNGNGNSNESYNVRGTLQAPQAVRQPAAAVETSAVAAPHTAVAR